MPDQAPSGRGGSGSSAESGSRSAGRSDVTAPGALLDRARELAGRIAGKAPLATAYARESVRAAGRMPLADGLEFERSLFAILSQTGDKAEAAQAFREKRAPVFRGC